ncbi:MAG: molybdopterin-dependent oxidoreductase [Rhizomicrobium sp.]
MTSWSRYDNHWQGVASKTLLDLVKPKADAKHIVFHAYDGYTTNVRTDVFADPNVLLAHSWKASRSRAITAVRSALWCPTGISGRAPNG